MAMFSVTPVPSWLWSLVLGALVTFYTCLGGLVGVVWTDLMQSVIMLVGMVTVTALGVSKAGGPSRIWELNEEGGRLQFYDFDPDPRTRHTFWGLSLGFAMGSLSFYGASQFTFQRFTATKTTTKAKLTVLLNLPTFYLFHFLLCGLGLVIYAYFAAQGCDPIASKQIRSPNQLLPYFVMSVLSDVPLAPGLFLAALTAGALSTISSVLNSTAALIWEDLLKGCVSGRRAAALSRVTVVVCGAIVVCLTFIADNFGPHIFQVCFALLGASGGPQLGMFLLGALVPWANAKGAVSGCLSGLALTLWVTVGAYITKPFSPPLPPAPSSQACLANLTAEGMSANISAHLNSNLSSNLSADLSALDSQSAVFGLYRLSYTWYTSVGVGACLLVGLIVSALTGGQQPEPPSRLVHPWYNNIRKCLTGSKARAIEADDKSQSVAETSLQQIDRGADSNLNQKLIDKVIDDRKSLKGVNEDRDSSGLSEKLINQKNSPPQAVEGERDEEKISVHNDSNITKETGEYDAARECSLLQNEKGACVDIISGSPKGAECPQVELTAL